MGEILDDKAKKGYQQRLRDLSELMEDARERGDHEELDTLQDEEEQIKAQLRAAYGLNGKPRKAGDENDRTRKRVCVRISDEIERMKTECPALGMHLDNAIQTGTFCSYQPESEQRWA